MRIWHVSVLLAVVAIFSVGQSVWAQTTKPAESTPVVVKDDAREQAGADTGKDGKKADPDGEVTSQPDGGKQPGGLFDNPKILIVMVAVMAMLWWWMGRGRRKEQQRHREMLSALKKGDKVTSIGGIIGTVIEVKDREVVVKVDESSNVRMKFLRSAIRSVGDIEKDEDSAGDSGKK